MIKLFFACDPITGKVAIGTRAIYLRGQWHASWRKLGDRYRVLFIGGSELDLLNTWGDPSHSVDLVEIATTDRPVEALLWGVKNKDNDDLWIELFIPHLMKAGTLHPSGVGVQTDMTKEALKEKPSARRLVQFRTYCSADAQERIFYQFTQIHCAPLNP